MKFHEAIAAGIRHIQQNKSRAGLSILGIFIGIASVLCMIVIGDDAKQIIAEFYPNIRLLVQNYAPISPFRGVTIG